MTAGQRLSPRGGLLLSSIPPMTACHLLRPKGNDERMRSRRLAVKSSVAALWQMVRRTATWATGASWGSTQVRQCFLVGTTKMFKFSRQPTTLSFTTR